MAALEDPRRTRIKYTISSLALSVVLSLIDMTTALLRDRRMKQVELMTRTSGRSVSPALSSFQSFSFWEFDGRECMKRSLFVSHDRRCSFPQSSISNTS